MATTESRIACVLAETAHLRDQVYRLRYACYRRTAAIRSSPCERFCDSYDALPNHFSFLAQTASGVPAATIRISVVRPDLGWTSAPSQKVFGDHPAFQRIAGGSFVEASRLCFYRQARRGALLQVVAYLAALADFYEAGWIVACPRIEHAHTYERLFGFVPLAEPRQYVGVGFQTSLLGVSRERLHTRTMGIDPMNAARARALASLWNARLRPRS